MDESLLIRYFLGELSDPEINEVENWIMLSEKNRTIAKDIYTIQLAIDTYDTIENVDANKALKKINNLLFPQKEKNRPKYKIWIHRFQQISAVLILPLLLVTFYLVFIFSGSELGNQFVEMSTTSGMTSSFTLPDSTKVWLNSNSRIRYPLRFDSEERQVQLVGEAFFEVSKDKKKKFVVKTLNNTSIQVLGTSFNVEAYEDIGEISTSLVTGIIRFAYTDVEKGKQFLDVLPNYKVTYDRNTGDITMSNTNVLVDTAWKDEKVVFLDTPFEDVLRILEKKFSVILDIKNTKLQELHFTGIFTHHPLDEILKHFEVASGVRYTYLPRMNGEKQVIELYY